MTLAVDSPKVTSLKDGKKMDCICITVQFKNRKPMVSIYIPNRIQMKRDREI
jgi:hypothetical protein